MPSYAALSRTTRGRPQLEHSSVAKDVVASALAQHLLCPINETEQEVVFCPCRKPCALGIYNGDAGSRNRLTIAIDGMQNPSFIGVLTEKI